jgi:hypothetical protein
MIVHDLDQIRTVVAPLKTNPPLIVDADRMLATAIAFQGFEPVAGRLPEIVELSRAIQQEQFAAGLPFDGAKPRHVSSANNRAVAVFRKERIMGYKLFPERE